MMKLIFLYTIFLTIAFSVLLPNQSFAEAQHINFRHLDKTEEPVARSLLSQDYFDFEGMIKKGFIHFPENIRIAYFPSVGDGRKIMFLYVRAGAACGTAGCDLLIWQKEEDWKYIGWEKSYDNGLIILDKKDEGYPEIWAAEHLIKWEGQEY
jgi:hypothetical protein